jgi:hypothetical protein
LAAGQDSHVADNQIIPGNRIATRHIGHSLVGQTAMALPVPVSAGAAERSSVVSDLSARRFRSATCASFSPRETGSCQAKERSQIAGKTHDILGHRLRLSPKHAKAQDLATANIDLPLEDKPLRATRRGNPHTWNRRRYNHVALLIPLSALLLTCSRSTNEGSHLEIETDMNTKAQWIEDAFDTLESGEYSRIHGLAWWHEDFEDTYLRLDSSEASLDTYRKRISSDIYLDELTFDDGKLLAIEDKIYHGAFPDFGSSEDLVDRERIASFQDLLGKKIAWAYFSNNWYSSLRFPATEIDEIHTQGATPFVRLMPRNHLENDDPETLYNLESIIDGDFDPSLRNWARETANLSFPILIEFGTEVNGQWFPWNGLHNGADTIGNYGSDSSYDGPERFRDAYRHIVDIFREAGATNTTWFFHVNASSWPEESWNTIEEYYPGDDYVDWIGISVYGPQTDDDTLISFEEELAPAYDEIVEFTDKPVSILEFGITELSGDPLNQADRTG